MEGSNGGHRITPDDAAPLEDEVASWRHFFLVTTFKWPDTSCDRTAAASRRQRTKGDACRGATALVPGQTTSPGQRDHFRAADHLAVACDPRQRSGALPRNHPLRRGPRNGSAPKGAPRLVSTTAAIPAPYADSSVFDTRKIPPLTFDLSRQERSACLRSGLATVDTVLAIKRPAAGGARHAVLGPGEGSPRTPGNHVHLLGAWNDGPDSG
jgi:hypothetical protein